MNDTFAVVPFLFKAFLFVYAVVIHEVAHGWVADVRGDPTARLLGRITLNPLPHIDLMGSIFVPALLWISTGHPFGWAKPVPVNPYNLKKPSRDMMFVGIAGPASNVIMALGFAALIHSPLVSEGTMAWDVLFFGVIINLILAFFNLIPVPPLDGSRIVAGLLPRVLAAKYNGLARDGMIFFVILMLTGAIRYLVIPPLVLALWLLGLL